MSDLELGLGLDEQRPQVRFELEASLGVIRLRAVHSSEPSKVQTIARFEVNDQGKVDCELQPLAAPLLCHAFGVIAGCPMPIVGLAKPEQPSGGPGIRISRSDAVAMLDLIDAGDLESLRIGIEHLIKSRKAEVAADLAGELPPDVVRLVIAARALAFGELRDLVNVSGDEDQRAMMAELDAASEAFASRVPWDDEPSDDEPKRVATPLGAKCAKCDERPIINLDGDDLCTACASKWVVAEGQAERDRQDEASA